MEQSAACCGAYTSTLSKMCIHASIHRCAVSHNGLRTRHGGSAVRVPRRWMSDSQVVNACRSSENASSCLRSLYNACPRCLPEPRSQTVSRRGAAAVCEHACDQAALA
eukprot:1498597-Rhodomonas_salina.1